MNKPISQHEFVMVGKCMWHLEAINQSTTAEDVFESIRNLRERLQKCGATATFAASASLANLELPVIGGSDIVTQVALNDVRLMLATVRDALRHEMDSRMMVELTTSNVSQRLLDLPETVTLNDTQTRLLEETCRCIEVGAYRAAKVMGWNLTYDYIRQWVFDNRLSEFNNALTTKYESNHPNPITEYEEFLTRKNLGEFVVIECMEEAKIINGKLSDRLLHYLRERNDFAHSNHRVPSVHTVNAYLENLLDIIISGPFA